MTALALPRFRDDLATKADYAREGSAPGESAGRKHSSVRERARTAEAFDASANSLCVTVPGVRHEQRSDMPLFAQAANRRRASSFSSWPGF
jgi:hypothetical protein